MEGLAHAEPGWAVAHAWMKIVSITSAPVVITGRSSCR